MKDYVIKMPFLSEKTKRKIEAFGCDLDYEGKQDSLVPKGKSKKSKFRHWDNLTNDRM